jgi:hypothetical protein
MRRKEKVKGGKEIDLPSKTALEISVSNDHLKGKERKVLKEERR